MSRPFVRRILLLILAFVSVAFAACTPEAPNRCNPDTCSGCCVDDACVAASKQDERACGAGGLACVACGEAERCVGGACAPLDPAATCGAAGQPCCDGACLEGNVCSEGQCVDLASARDGGACGGLGEDCCAGVACNGSLRCEAGTCIRPTDAGVLRVGDPCASDPECSTGTCLKTGFAGGYCSRPCTGTGTCPSGSTCGVNPNDGFSQVCLRTCAEAGAVSDCREGYVCDRAVARTGSQGVCIPACGGSAVKCSPATKCASGFCCGAENYVCCGGTSCDPGLACGVNGHCRLPSSSEPIGASCANNTDCAGLECFEEQAAGETGCSGGCWLGGYCSQKCGTGQSSCPTGSSCSPYVLTEHNSGGNTTYVNSCLDDCVYDGGRGDCRLGYVCDKTLASKPACLQRCHAAADCNVGGVTGLRCDNIGFCCGKRNYPCCGGGTTPACASGQGTCQSGICK